MVRSSGDRIPAADEASGGPSSWMPPERAATVGASGSAPPEGIFFARGSPCFFCHVFAIRGHVGAVGERRWMSPPSRLTVGIAAIARDYAVGIASPHFAGTYAGVG